MPATQAGALMAGAILVPILNLKGQNQCRRARDRTFSDDLPGIRGRSEVLHEEFGGDTIMTRQH